MECEQYPALKINAPEWFRREDFRSTLRRFDSVATPLATWHRGGAPHDYSDVFTVVTGMTRDEISDDFPDDISDALLAAVRDAGLSGALVWITNLEG